MPAWCGYSSWYRDFSIPTLPTQLTLSLGHSSLWGIFRDADSYSLGESKALWSAACVNPRITGDARDVDLYGYTMV